MEVAGGFTRGFARGCQWCFEPIIHRNPQACAPFLPPTWRRAAIRGSTEVAESAELAQARELAARGCGKYKRCVQSVASRASLLQWGASSFAHCALC
jgi:hypothetical protein